MDKREAIQNVLKKYQIVDHEALLDELIDLFDRLRVAPNLPAPTGDTVSDWARISALHQEREQAEQSMLDRLEEALGITPNGRPEWDTIARFLIEKESERCAETIETFAANCRLDPFSTPKTHQIAKDPMQIKTNWIHVMAMKTEPSKGKGNNEQFFDQLKKKKLEYADGNN
jgi:hypothetical protein